MQTVPYYQEQFSSYLNEKIRTREPINLYEPMTYIISLGGKRLRPVLALMATDLFNGSYKQALDAALAIEVFHNFSLVHDDIMDAAPLRRGKRTVHKKWDINTGILSGDAMLIEAYRFLEPYEEAVFKKLMVLFSRTAMEVCEGQQYDVDFETRDDVTIPEYLKMITFKTAVLVAAALKMGAIIGRASHRDQEAIYAFGLNLGIAFQLQDDFLDAFGDPKTFGKQIGGDIIENKKTYLYLKSLELGDAKTTKELIDLFSIQPGNSGQKINRVKEIYEISGASEHTRMAIKKYTEQAFKNLELLDVPEDKKAVFRKFGEELMGRSV